MTGSSMSQIAVLFTARALGNMSGAVVSGMLVDRFPGHRVLIVMALLMAAGLAATGHFAWTTFWLVALFGVLLVTLFWLTLSAGTGAMVVPSLAGPLLEWAGTRAFPLLLAGLVALLILGLAALRARVARTSDAGSGSHASA